MESKLLSAVSTRLIRPPLVKMPIKASARPIVRLPLFQNVNEWPAR